MRSLIGSSSSAPDPAKPMRRHGIGSRFGSVLCLSSGLLLCLLPCVAQSASTPDRGETSDDRVFQQAVQSMEQGDLATAKRLLLQLQAAHPHNFPVEESLGEVFAAENDWQASSHWLEQAVQDQASPSAEVLANLGVAYWKTGRLQAAQGALERSERLAPDSAQTEALLSAVEEALGHFDLSARHALRAAEIEPTEARFNEAGLEFLRHWSFDPAETTFKTGLTHYPQSVPLRFGLAIAFYGGQHYQQAVPILAALLNEFPAQPAYARLFGQSCAAVSQGERADCSAFVAFAEAKNDDGQLLTLAATWLMQNQTSPENQQHAERLLQRALQLGSPSPEAQYEMGLLQQHAAHWSESVPYLREAIRLRPDYSQAHYRLGLALAHLGQKEEASAQMKLQQQLSEIQKADLDRRLNEIQTIVVEQKPQ